MKFLRRLFIKNYQNVQDETVRSAHGILAAWLGLLINVILVGMKLSLAILLASQSSWIFPMALLADCIDSAGDMASNIVTLVGFRAASKPADADHPYGHERMEYIAGILVATLVLVAGGELIVNSIKGIVAGDAAFYTWPTVIVLVVALGLKVLQGLMNLNLAKTISSPALKATAIDSFTDTAATFAVVLSAILSITLNWTFLDGYFGIGVACFIIYAGIRMIQETANPLIGLAFSAKDVEDITSLAMQRPGILGVHDVLFHRYGPTKVFITLHVEVSADQKLPIIHETIDSLEREINAKYHAETTIHMDPVESDQESKEVREKIMMVLKRFYENPSMHDLHIYHDDKGTRIEFDVLLPYSLGTKKEEILKALSQAFPHKQLDVIFDHSYVE